jgi:glycosyltransferase involved in cell wall biosynthesis
MKSIIKQTSKQKKFKKITIIIPCRNEEKGIGQVLDEIPKNKLKALGYETEILVIDNNSTDNTSKIAKSKGAKVIREEKPGKGNAIRTGFRNISKDTDFVVMLDGDNTYKAHEIPRMIEPLDSNFCDVIVGSRLEGKMIQNAMSFSHRFVNWCWTFFVRQFYGANITDTCTGFFAWKRNVITNLNGYIVSPGFAIEAEMVTKMAKLGHKLYSVPIIYAPRKGQSKIAPIGDGAKISWMLIKNLFWKPKK